MTKLNTSLVEKKCLQQQSHKSLIKEINKDHLKKITHLFMDDQGINEIEDFSTCKSLKVIYLQINCIEKIQNLDFAVNVTHLYLQHNEITKISNLGNMVKLKKLFLGYNRIPVIEGLENLINLSELHVEKQKLALGERLCFEPRTTSTLAGCLTYLNISNNKVTSLNDLRNFDKLVTLEAKDNLIKNIKDLTETISSLRRLENLFIQGNPVTKICRYRENLIANSYSITILDEKHITENSREFLRRFKLEKLQQSRKKLDISLSEDITSSLNLPPAFRRSVSRAMFQNINPVFSFPGISTGVTPSQIFPSWKSTLSTKEMKNSHILPRPFWRNQRNGQNIIKNKTNEKTANFSTFYK